MKLTDIKKACNSILLNAFESKIPVYGNDTYDGYTRPAFFTEIVPRQYARQSLNAVQEAYTYHITYLEQTHDEAVCLDIVDTVREAFGLSIRTDSGRITVDEMDYSWIDANNDVLQITIDFAATRKVLIPKSDAPLMEELDMEVEAVLEGELEIIGS